MFKSLARTLTVARAQIRICRSLVRFWVTSALLTVIVLVGYIQSCVWQTLNASYSPSFSLAQPKYLLGSVDALVFLAFQFAAILLVFDVRQYHNRNRVQTVLESRQLTNIEYLLGSVLGVTFLLYLVVLCNIAIIEGLGALSYFLGSAWGGFLEPVSVFNLLIVDVFPSLFLWSCVALALTSILRSGFVAVIIASSLLVVFYIGSLIVPFSWLDVVTPSTNFTAYISELVPNFASSEVIGMRAFTVVGALGLIVFAAFVLDRRDARVGFVNLPLGLAMATLGVYGFGMLSHQLINQYFEPEDWSNIHAAYDQSVELDIDEIQGSVTIDPGHRLMLDLTYDFRLTQETDIPQLTFTLNSGLTINLIELNGDVVDFQFSDGLLIVPTGTPLRRGETQEMVIQAEGIPDPRFAYLDSPFNYFNDRTVPRRAPQLFGKDGSIFSTKYVALMPGMYWYPVPYSQSLARSSVGEIDFFQTDIEFSLTNPNWLLVGTDIKTLENAEATFELRPDTPISEIAVFGTNFVKHSLTIADIQFNLYLHASHQKNFGKFNFDDEKVREEIEEIFVPFEEAGLGYPFNELSFVEVPNRLRTLSGGFKTESVQVLPGLILMKERGFPTAHFDTRIKRIERWVEDEEWVEHRKYWALADYFGDAVGTDNLWASFSKTFWTHSTTISGTKATVLNDLVQNVISQISEAPDLWFSPYATYQVADFTQVFLPAVEWSIDEGGGGELTDWVRSLSQRYLNRHSVWEAMETKSLFDLPTTESHQSDLEFMLAKNRMIARVFVQANDNDAILAWLSSLRNANQGTSFTPEELVAQAEAAELNLHPYLDEWLTGSNLPGYLVSDITRRQLTDDEDGNARYESSFYVYNPSDTTGVFWAAYPPETRRNWPRTPTVTVEGKSSVRINVVTTHEIDYIHLFPNLSLNRNEFGTRLDESSLWQENDESPEPRPSFEVVDWRPSNPWIVVDDLDPGFAVDQPPAFNSASSIGPLGWLRIPRLQADNDNGLPARANYAYRTSRGVWGRIQDDNSYGHFRRTATVTRFAPEIHPVAFSTEIPDTTRWKLEYFINTDWFRRSSRRGEYHLEIEHAEATERRDLSFEDSIYGWNEVDEFELLKGDVNVRVISATNDTPWLYADAIRWVPVSTTRNINFEGGGGGGS